MITTRTVKTEFSSVPMRKLNELESQGWRVNGVHIQRTEEDGTFRHGAVTAQGMVMWWHGVQEARKPVAEFRGTMEYQGRTLYLINPKADLTRGMQLYTTPQAQRQPLTDERIMEIVFTECDNMRWPSTALFIARAIEQAHGITKGPAA